MADAKHTPGPWVISGISQEDGSISIAKDRIVIAYATNASSFGDFINATLQGRKDFGAPDTAVTQYANALLIAAAPETAAERDRLREINAELLAALKYFIAETDDNDADYEPRTSPHAVARAALAKATGQGGDT